MSVSRTSGFSEEVRTWLAECLPRAIVYARSLVRDVDEADDVVQECVYRLLKRAAHYDLPQDGSRLLFRAVTNECINRTTRGPDWVSLETTDEEGHSLGSTIGDPRAEQPLDRVLTDELRRVLDAALDELPLCALHPGTRTGEEIRDLVSFVWTTAVAESALTRSTTANEHATRKPRRYRHKGQEP